MAIKWDRLTVKSQEAVQAASGHAAENGNPEVLPLHLMAALLEDREGVVIPVLERVGVPVEQLLSGVNAAIEKLPKVQGGGQPGMSAALQKVLERAFKEAENFKDEYVSTEHLFLAIAGQDRDPAGQLLKRQGASHERILQALTGLRGSQRVTSQNPEATYAALEKYAASLPELAARSTPNPLLRRVGNLR